MHTTHTFTNRLVTASRTAAVAAALVALTAASAAAQDNGSRWQGWIGCWTAAPPELTSTAAPLVCVTPTSDVNAVDVATISEGKVLSTRRIDASGKDQPIEAKDCTGTQRAQWSADGRRVFLKAVERCQGAERTTSGILGMTPEGQWLDVQGVAAGDAENVRVARYRDAGVPKSVPANIAAALEGRSGSATSSRIIAGAGLGTSAVIEASHAATPSVVEAWLLERGQTFALDANTLVTLADAGVPARVTDAMVAVSNPKTFAIAHPNSGASAGAIVTGDEDEVAGRRISVYMEPMYSPFGWGYSPYGYGGYGLGYGYGGYGYNPLGYGGYSGYPGYYGGSPIIIVGQPGTVTPRGRMVKGRGYTRSPSNGSPPSTRSAGSSSSSSSGSSSSGASPSRAPDPAPAPAPVRTAHPRP